MADKTSHKLRLLFLIILVLLLMIAELIFGPVTVPLSDIWKAVTGNIPANDASQIIIETRILRALVALSAGAALSLAGWLLQTLFRNPLAGPDILGISSGASLGVALLVLGSGSIITGVLASFSIALAAMVGAMGVLLLLLFVSRKLPDNTSLLIFGMMCSFLSGAIVSGLESKSGSESLRSFVLWGMGTFADAGWTDLLFIFSALAISAIVISTRLKHLNFLLLGDDYTSSMGVDIKKIRVLIIVITGILAGVVTAFCGPVAFIGLAVPVAVRTISGTSNHKKLLGPIALAGSAAALLSDLICRLAILPLNTITCALGAPVVVYVLISKRKKMVTL